MLLEPAAPCMCVSVTRVFLLFFRQQSESTFEQCSFDFRNPRRHEVNGNFLLRSLNARRIGRSSHTALRSECESFCHVSDYFSVWSGIFENFHLVFSSGIWCYRTEKVKMNFFPLSSFFLSNFGGNEKVCNTRNPAYL